MIEYALGNSGQALILTDPVLTQFRKHRQLKWRQREAGGQLFARFEGERIIVEEATGPRRSDFRTLLSFRPNRKAEQEEINERHRSGLHYVGDWHTHPDDAPQPSAADIQSIGDCVRRSRHDLNAFFLVIVGRLDAPAGLSVSLHDGRAFRTFAPAASKPSDGGAKEAPGQDHSTSIVQPPSTRPQ